VKPELTTSNSTETPEPFWRRCLGVLGLLLSLPFAIPFLVIMGIGDLILSPFYPPRGPYSGPPAIYRSLVGVFVFAVLLFAVLRYFRHHSSRTSYEPPILYGQPSTQCA
jgi:hypothetical protein